LFFLGGFLHPGDDPPGLSLKQHLLLLYEDPTWVSSHALLLAGMALIAGALVALAWSGVLDAVQPVAKVAAVAAVVGTVSSFLHLISALDADRIAAGEATPLTDVNLVVESLAVPAFGLSIAALAALGAKTRTLGNWPIAALAIIGGIGYALAAGSALFTDVFNPLFPTASGIAVWAIAAGVGLLQPRRRRGRDLVQDLGAAVKLEDRPVR
jgi:hypothetical protein